MDVSWVKEGKYRGTPNKLASLDSGCARRPSGHCTAQHAISAVQRPNTTSTFSEPLLSAVLHCTQNGTPLTSVGGDFTTTKT
jgi:hypothetical protein